MYEMDKMKRAERLIAITQLLMGNANTLLPLAFLAERFGAAKSTISEDLVTIRETLSLTGQGKLETVSGAAGGVRFIPGMSNVEAAGFLSELARRLSDKERILPGGFLYLSDILFNPALLRPLGYIFAGAFRERKPDMVITIETKGIPLALVTAEALGLPMEIIRHGNKVTEGSSVSINYVSGSTKRIQSMSLSRRALEKGKKVLLIDDFMKAGGTLVGMMNLMSEFEANVVGAGVLMEAAGASEGKLVEQYLSLLRLTKLEPAAGIVEIKPVELG